MSEKFTKGPWDGKEIDLCRQYDAGLQLAFLSTTDPVRLEEGKANAYLIKAAPLLYAALKELCDSCMGGCEDCNVSETLKAARGES